MPMPSDKEKNACPNAFITTDAFILLKSGCKKNSRPSDALGNESATQANASNRKPRNLPELDDGYGSELFKACFYLFFAVFYNHQSLIAFYIGSDGACTHMSLKAQNAVPDIVVMRYLNLIE